MTPRGLSTVQGAAVSPAIAMAPLPEGAMMICIHAYDGIAQAANEQGIVLPIITIPVSPNATLNNLRAAICTSTVVSNQALLETSLLTSHFQSLPRCAPSRPHCEVSTDRGKSKSGATAMSLSDPFQIMTLTLRLTCLSTVTFGCL